MGVAGLLLLPLASSLLPTLRIPISTEMSQAPVVKTVVDLSRPFPQDLNTPFLPSSIAISPSALALPTPDPSIVSTPTNNNPSVAALLSDLSLAQWGILLGAVLYLIGVLYFLGRLVSGLFYVSALRHQVRDIEDAAILKVLTNFSQQLGLHRPVKLAASERIAGPTQVGCLAPMIVVPPALLYQRDRREFAPIIAHELAHVYRWDYLFNLLMSLVQALH